MHFQYIGFNNISICHAYISYKCAFARSNNVKFVKLARQKRQNYFASARNQCVNAIISLDQEPA